MRKIGIQEIEDIATGAALLGAGGGGDPYVGKLVAMGAVQECGPITLLDPEEVPDDALVVPIDHDGGTYGSCGKGHWRYGVSEPVVVWCPSSLERRSMPLCQLKQAVLTPCCPLRQRPVWGCRWWM